MICLASRRKGYYIEPFKKISLSYPMAEDYLSQTYVCLCVVWKRRQDFARYKVINTPTKLRNSSEGAMPFASSISRSLLLPVRVSIVDPFLSSIFNTRFPTGISISYFCIYSNTYAWSTGWSFTVLILVRPRVGHQIPTCMPPLNYISVLHVCQI